MKIGDEIMVHGFVDEIRQDTVIVRNAGGYFGTAASEVIDTVRCQDCKYWVYNFNGCSRNPCTEPWYATDFCNYGEREGER